MKAPFNITFLVFAISFSFSVYAEKVSVHFEKSWGPGTLVTASAKSGIL